jgi:acyl transferase domain-containing protein
VNLAYHSKAVAAAAEQYEELLRHNVAYASPPPTAGAPIIFSTVLGRALDEPATAAYWKRNKVSLVLFTQCCREMLSRARTPINVLIEIGPSDALAGPIGQITQELGSPRDAPAYIAAAERGPDSMLSMYRVACQLFLMSGDVNFAAVNQYGTAAKANAGAAPATTLVDLPNYAWNQATPHWYESVASKEWRFRPFLHYDLLGSKVLGASWKALTYWKTLCLNDVPWLADHKLGADITFPASCYILMAIETVRQCHIATRPEPNAATAQRWQNMLVVDDTDEIRLALTLTPRVGMEWYHFSIPSTKKTTEMEHCGGMIRISEMAGVKASTGSMLPRYTIQ